jgi:hypothetical protein
VQRLVAGVFSTSIIASRLGPARATAWKGGGGRVIVWRDRQLNFSRTRFKGEFLSGDSRLLLSRAELYELLCCGHWSK